MNKELENTVNNLEKENSLIKEKNKQLSLN